MKIAIANIEVADRSRQALGDLDSLARSMKEVGLLHPIVITGEGRLIAGERRLRAAEKLGWSSIEARKIDLDDPLRAERDENEQRKPLTKSEAVAVARAILEREKIAAKGRQGRPGQARSEDSSERKGEAKDIAASAVGMHRETLAKATEIVEAAAADPVHADLVQAMDETGKVDPFHRELQQRRQEAGIATAPIVSDPLAERHCPKCGRDTPSWVLNGEPQPEGSRPYRFLARLRGK